jgi:hypothetical protein
MTKRELAALACKLLGIFFFVSSISSVLLLPFTFGSQIDGFIQKGADLSSILLMILTVSISILGSFLYLVAGLLLWFKAGKFAARIFSEDSSPTTLAVSSNILPMAFSLTGVIIVALILPHLLGMFIAHNMASDPQVSNWDKTHDILDLTASFVQMLLGIWLIFGAGKISTTIQRALSLTRDQ